MSKINRCRVKEWRVPLVIPLGVSTVSVAFVVSKNATSIAVSETIGALLHVLGHAMSWRKPFNGVKDLLRFAVFGFIDPLGLLVQIGYPLKKEARIMYRAMFPVPSSSPRRILGHT